LIEAIGNATIECCDGQVRHGLSFETCTDTAPNKLRVVVFVLSHLLHHVLGHVRRHVIAAIDSA
jgi:hypothetical protein